MPRLLSVLMACCLVTTVVRGGDTVAVRYESDVRPILKAHCWHCHGEEEKLQGGLDTRLVHLMLKGGDSGAALVAGKHGESLLYERISSGEMPPGKKKLSAKEIETIARWIDGGAKVSRPEPKSLADGDVFTDEERGHWSFQPIRKSAVPAVQGVDRTRNDIDRFLLARLEKEQLSFGPEADRVTLIRRLSFDLTGLPPTPETVSAFVNDPATDAYERLVDRLLGSPAYGERWGRHWLDVAGYADSDGYNDADSERKWAYRYRDYVIRAFNEDKPWDRFLVEQLAGDELLAPPYANLTPEQADCLIGTGFLRMGPDGTGTGNADADAARNDVVAETIKIVSTSLLGLTVGCAQCHQHRYDPITHADYYRMRALIEPAYDWKDWRAPNGRLVSLWSDATRKQAADVDAELKTVNDERMKELDKLVGETFDRELAKLPKEIQPQAKQARETDKKKRTKEQQELIKTYPFLNVDRGSVYLYLPDRLVKFNKDWDHKTEETKKKRPAEDLVMCLTEVPGKASPTLLFSRGDFRQPRQGVLPGELAVLSGAALNGAEFSIAADDPKLPTTGRRLAYARHLTDGKHPLVGRVLVNRFWLHHFGKGLVATPGEFGHLGAKPTHPELLDWLASDFMEGGWKLKRLQRMIVTSAAYRQSSQRRDELQKKDPENVWLGRMPVRRLEAETIRDTLLAVSGRLNTTMFGPSVPITPDEVGQVVVGVDTRDTAGRPTGKVVPLYGNEFRRSIYVQVRRSMPLGMLEPFDVPIMSPNCEARNSSTVAPQSLLMMNSPFLVEQAEAMAMRVQQEVGTVQAAQFQRAWQLAFGRTPTAGEMQSGMKFLLDQTALIAKNKPKDAKQKVMDPNLTALADLCHALVSSNGFLYTD